jgi:hypothetical protein
MIVCLSKVRDIDINAAETALGGSASSVCPLWIGAFNMQTGGGWDETK